MRRAKVEKQGRVGADGWAQVRHKGVAEEAPVNGDEMSTTEAEAGGQEAGFIPSQWPRVYADMLAGRPGVGMEDGDGSASLQQAMAGMDLGSIAVDVMHVVELGRAITSDGMPPQMEGGGSGGEDDTDDDDMPPLMEMEGGPPQVRAQAVANKTLAIGCSLG